MGIRVPQVGDTLGRYLLKEEIGRGGMAVVYRAEDTSLRRDVALKILHAQFWNDPQYLERFGREARAVAAVRHPNIIEIHDFGGGGDEGPAFIVTELIRGSDLGDFLKAQGRLLPEVAVLIALRIADALGAAHRAGIIHRDVKPENVLIAEGGRVLLTDFGIARMIEGDTLTQTGSLVGSPSYMSPEQAQGKDVDARSDFFSLAAMVYKMCTGQVPFPGKDPISTVLKIVEGKYQPPVRLNPQIGKELNGIVCRMLDANMDARPADAEAVSSELLAFLERSGLERTEEELRDYFAAPDAFNDRLVTRVCEGSLDAAQNALRGRQFPQALALCDRILAYDDQHSGALSLLDQLTARQGRKKAIVIAGVVLAIAGSVAGAIILMKDGPVSPQPDSAIRNSASQDISVGNDGQLVKDSSSDRAVIDAASLPLDTGLRRGKDQGTDIRARRQVRPNTKRKRRRDAGLVIAKDLLQPTPRKVIVDAAPPPLPRLGRLIVSYGPWCTLFVDDKKVGTSPMRNALEVSPGRHKIRCVDHAGGVRQATVNVVAGKLTTLRDEIQKVKIRVSLTRGDAIKIEGKTYRADFTVRPNRYRVNLYRGEKELEGSYLNLFRPCHLKDTPRLTCK